MPTIDATIRFTTMSPRDAGRGTAPARTARFVDRSGLAELTPAWRDLAANAGEPNAFHHRWFLDPALAAYDAADAVRLWTLREPDGRLLGLLPLSAASHYGTHPIPHLANWMHYNAFLGTPLVRAGYELEFWQKLFAAVDAIAGRALFLHLNGLVLGGPVEAALHVAARADRRRCDLVHVEERAFLQSDLDPATYFEANVRGKKRKELRRQRKRLEEMGTLSFRASDRADDLDVWIADFLRLEASGWKGANNSAIGSHADSRDFFAALLREAAAAGALQRLDCHFDGRPIAMLVNFLTPPGSFSFKTAFDEAFARFSPGVLLQLENLEILTRPDVAWMDSCAAEGHPMIDSLWAERRRVGRYSVAIGGPLRRAGFGTFRLAESWRARRRKGHAATSPDTKEIAE